MSNYLYISALDKERTTLQASITVEVVQDDDTDPSDVERLQDLNQLREDMGDAWDRILRGASDGLIPEDEWERFAEQDAYGGGFVEEDSPIVSYVDWSRWADGLKQDYQSVEFEGTTYWYRA